jgi:hypothetical protein
VAILKEPKRKDRVVVGWREWLSLPELHVMQIKAKVDTGARTSALHAEDIRYVRRRGGTLVQFVVTTEQEGTLVRTVAIAPLLDERKVRSSNGTAELRPVIETRVRLGEREWSIEVTLTRRDMMGFPMLLGRQAVKGHAVVDPGRSFLNGKTVVRAVKLTEVPG